MAERFATIDIGTNTILMLIAEKGENNKIIEIADEHLIARLGEGIGNSSSKLILQSAIERAKKILARYKSLCDDLWVSNMFIAGTSALRDAINRDQVLEELESVIGNKINVIPGEEEALFSFRGAVDDDKDSIVIDIGGGSTEIIRGATDKITDRVSLQIGAVRITENFFRDYPPDIEDLIRAEIEIASELDKIEYLSSSNVIYAVAGTPTTLAGVAMGLDEFSRDRIDGYFLELEVIKNLFHEFQSISINDIIEIYRVHPNRADIITAGTLILIKILEKLNAGYCIASTKGLRYGMMKSLFEMI